MVGPAYGVNQRGRQLPRMALPRRAAKHSLSAGPIQHYHQPTRLETKRLSIESFRLERGRPVEGRFLQRKQAWPLRCSEVGQSRERQGCR
jgi:hypothetical protein